MVLNLYGIKLINLNFKLIFCFFSVYSFEPFEGGETNLLLSLQQKTELSENVFLEKLFFVFHLWYTGKDNTQELDKVNFYLLLTYLKFDKLINFTFLDIF